MNGESELHCPSSDGAGLTGESHADLPPRTKAGMKELLRAFDYARTADRDDWAFAVEIDLMFELGLTRSDLRWLACMGYIKHARETTRCDEDGRRFRPLGNLSFPKRTCFILTASGAAIARSLDHELATGQSSCRRPQPPDRSSFDLSEPPSFSHDGCGFPTIGTPDVFAGLAVPAWDAERRELRVCGALVKRFKWPAANQEIVLAAFEEEGWPSRIDDPLPVEAEQDPKRRLHDTIKCLNRKQERPLLHFRGDGTGEGVVWEFAPRAGRESVG